MGTRRITASPQVAELVPKSSGLVCPEFFSALDLAPSQGCDFPNKNRHSIVLRLVSAVASVMSAAVALVVLAALAAAAALLLLRRRQRWRWGRRLLRLRLRLLLLRCCHTVYKQLVCAQPWR